MNEELLDFVEARLETTYAYGLSALDWDRAKVAKQIIQKAIPIIRAEAIKEKILELEEEGLLAHEVKYYSASGITCEDICAVCRLLKALEKGGK